MAKIPNDFLPNSNNFRPNYFNSVLEANEAIVTNARYLGKIVLIKDNQDIVKQYWYSGGIADINLVEVTAGGGGGQVVVPGGGGGAINPTDNYIPVRVDENTFGNSNMSQNASGGIGIGIETPNSTSILELSSTNKVFTPTRLTTLQINALSNPLEGSVCYNTDTKTLMTYNNNAWISLSVSFNRQSSSYTLALSDMFKLVETNVATANNLTVPLNSSVAFPIGTKIDIMQYNIGQTTFVPAVGVTIRSFNNWLKLNSQYAGGTLMKVDTNEWYLVGNLSP